MEESVLAAIVTLVMDAIVIRAKCVNHVIVIFVTIMAVTAMVVTVETVIAIVVTVTVVIAIVVVAIVVFFDLFDCIS